METPRGPAARRSNRGRRLATLVACALLSWTGAHAQDARDDTLAWQWQVLPAADGSGASDVVLSARIKLGWILYASDFEAPEFGPRPARLAIDARPGYRPQGGLVAVDAREGEGSNFAGDYRYTYFSGRAEFRQRLQVEAGADRVGGTISGQTCFEETGLCTLFRESFDIALK